jgi:hypothetical protein
MSGNPFTDLQQAFANLGLDYALAGIILASIFTFCLMIILIIILDPKAKGRSDTTMMISVGIGLAISYGVGWLQTTVGTAMLIFIGIFLAYIVIDPLGNKHHSSG